MVKPRMRHFFLAVLFVMLSGFHASAQQSPLESITRSGLALEITTPDLSPSTLPVYEDRAFETTWSGDIPRTRTRPNDNDHKGLNIPIKILREGDAVRVDLRVGLESFKEVPLATYHLRPDQSVTVREVTTYGFQPFVLKLIRIEIKMPVVIPPLAALPEIENRLKSIEVIGLEKGASADQNLLSLRNNGTKNVIALEIIMPTGGTRAERGTSNKPLIAAGATYKIEISAQTRGRITDGVFEPDPVQPQGVLSAALFDDGTYEGDYVSAATMDARLQGRKLQLERVVALLEKALRPESQEAVTTFEDVKEAIYSLDVDGDAATVEAVSKHYPPLDNRLEYVAQGVKTEMAACKYDLIGKLKAYEEDRHSAGIEDLRVWLQRTKEYFESLLDAY
jgi:hypothetical protein